MWWKASTARSSSEVDAKQCPHCKLWLISKVSDAGMDPWEHDYDERATKRVNMIGPRAGCFAIFVLEVAGTVTLVLKTISI
jgi:hypothetical protein